METLLQAHPDVTAVYAHNDEMAIGAIAALEAAGRKPGQDVILVSIDGENAAMDAIVAGKLGASVESSPFFGPISHDTMMKYVNGEDIPDWVVVEDRFFDIEQRQGLPGQAVLARICRRPETENGEAITAGYPSLCAGTRRCGRTGVTDGAERPLPLLTMDGIVKVFPGSVALDGARLHVGQGEVHAIVGQNGAGKSTLMKVLNGAYRRDGGTIVLDGQPVDFVSPHAGAA